MLVNKQVEQEPLYGTKKGRLRSPIPQHRSKVTESRKHLCRKAVILTPPPLHEQTLKLYNIGTRTGTVVPFC